MLFVLLNPDVSVSESGQAMQILANVVFSKELWWVNPDTHAEP